jgi:hypothetical protein
MLRGALLAVGTVLLAAAMVAAMEGIPWLPFGIGGAVLVLALLFERHRYRGAGGGRPGAGWEDTGERFTAPESGRTVSVWFNPRTGERRYVED